MNENTQKTRVTARPDVTNNSNTQNESEKGATLTSTIGSTQGSDRSPTASNNIFIDNSNSIKILKRPTKVEQTASAVVDFTRSEVETNQCHSSICPQITLEDNTRTQYVPQVRILKRPNANKDSATNDRSLSGNRSQTNNKTLEEREAEYARARLRIMGSASAPEESNQNSSSRSSPQTTSSSNSSPKWSPLTNNSESNVPILRLPVGPDGTRGFNRDNTSEQR